MSARAEQEAATWALRHPLAGEDQAELDRWLARDDRHAGLLLRAMAGMSAIDQALLPQEQPIDAGEPLVRRRNVLVGAGAAMAAALAGVVGWSQLHGERVATRRGEIRRLPLADGSVATINTDSELRVAFGREDRRVELDRGQAWFQVAKDRRRPFVVDAGVASARAVGTAFSVERRGNDVRISVTEGVVAVWAAGARGAVTILQAGQVATFENDSAQPSVASAPAAIERSLAWRNGEISIEDETLESVVAQFNRYNPRQLVVADPSLSRERLVGLFQIDKPEDFAATLAASHDIAVTTTTDRITLNRKRN